MDARRFFETVVLMRDLQKEYFKTRDKAVLTRSKAIEKTIDDEIRRVLTILDAKKSAGQTSEGNLF